MAASVALPAGGENSGKHFMMDVKQRLGDGHEYTRFKAEFKEAVQIIKAATKSSCFTSATPTPIPDAPREQVLKALQSLRRLLSAPALSSPPSVAPQLIPMLPRAVQADARQVLVGDGPRNGARTSLPSRSTYTDPYNVNRQGMPPPRPSKATRHV